MTVYRSKGLLLKGSRIVLTSVKAKSLKASLEFQRKEKASKSRQLTSRWQSKDLNQNLRTSNKTSSRSLTKALNSKLSKLMCPSQPSLQRSRWVNLRAKSQNLHLEAIRWHHNLKSRNLHLPLASRWVSRKSRDLVISKWGHRKMRKITSCPCLIKTKATLKRLRQRTRRKARLVDSKVSVAIN